MDRPAKLPGDYVAGFVDGEGCFALKFRRDRKQNLGNKKFRDYFYWGLELAVVLRADDLPLLISIQTTLKCGKINSLKNNQARFSVQNPKEICEKVIPFFKKYLIRGKKGMDFKLWSEGAHIIQKYRDGQLNVKRGRQGFIKKEMSLEDLRKLKEIRNQMIEYKSKRTQPFKWQGNVAE